MCTYCGTDNYYKIYEKHHGPIPMEPNGRRYEIHHLDNNHSNNDPNNLIAVTLKEHYDIHYSQQDWNACRLMKIQRMEKTPEEISELASKAAFQRVKEGTHHFLGGTVQSKKAQERVEQGTHPFLGGAVQRKSNQERLENGTHHMIQKDNPSKKRVEAKTHNFLKRSDGSSLSADRVKAGTHNFIKSWYCSVCDRHGKGTSNFARYHSKCMPKV